MKLVIVTGIVEYRDDIAGIFKKAQVPLFTESETTGHNNILPVNLQNNWFGRDRETYQAVLFFSFTGDEQAAELMSSVNAYNKQTELSYPIHAFILPVESWSA